jgi:lipid A 3-O-deacylase
VTLRLRSLLAIVLACAPALLPTPAAAQLREVRLVLDNDAYNFWIPFHVRPDHDYTNGIDLSLELAGGPLWASALAPRTARCTAAAPADSVCTATTLSFGQKIFTPKVDGAAPVAGQRPYAGWLYASATAAVQSAARVRRVGVEVGVTGTPSLGEAVHTTWHRVAGFDEPAGWDNQLAFEPAFRIAYDESVLLADVRSGGVRIATLAPAWGADAGTLHVGAHAGLAVRAGWGVPHPWSAAADRGAGPASVYALGRVQQNAVARDLFLDGSTFRSSIHVDRRPLVWEHELGGGVRYRGFTVEYRALTRGREYQTQSRPHTWSTFELRYRVR